MVRTDDTQPVIMVVDDSEDVRDLLKTALVLRGYRVLEAVNGREAVDIARNHCPDLILMDLSMPVLDGFAATRMIREATEVCNVPIVAFSAHNTSDHHAKAFAVGFNEYLTKPVNFERLESVLHRFLKAA
jgi:two-component system cell cycle response regulator DivK